MQGALPDILNPFDASRRAPGVRSPDKNQAVSSPDEHPAAASSTGLKRPHSRIKSSYPRKRAIQACQKCRIRRTKCDNLRPSCSACLDLKVECTYSDADPSSFDAASLAILEKLGTLERLVRAGQAEKATPTTVSTIVPSPERSVGTTSLGRESGWESLHLNIENVLSWPAFEDQRPALDLKQLLRVPSGSNSGRLMSLVELENVPKERLIQQFIDSVYIFNPIIEESRIQKYLIDSRYNGLGWDGPSCLLLLIYAHGSLADVRPSSEAYVSRHEIAFKHAESFFAEAQTRMGLLLTQSGVVEAQCFFLAGVYLMATIRPLDAWRMFVQSLACCQTFCGAAALSDAGNDSESRIRKSLYWTCFKSELELRLELNAVETSVWDLRYPSFFPSPPEELKTQREIVWYFYLAEIALRRLGNRVLNYIYSQPPAQSTAEMIESIRAFEQQATDWVASLPKDLHLKGSVHDAPDQGNLNQTLRFILRGELCDCYEMMYWPFIVEAANSTQKSINYDFVRKALEVCVERLNINEPGFFYRHHGTWCMLRACTRSAFVLLAAFRTAAVRHLLPTGWREAIRKVIEMLRYWRRESADISNRLELLERIWQSL